jgi:hypothetical protein
MPHDFIQIRERKSMIIIISARGIPSGGIIILGTRETGPQEAGIVALDMASATRRSCRLTCAEAHIDGVAYLIIK